MKEKCLIVNADDFGLSRGITDGIIHAHLYGFVSSASLMPNMCAAEYAVSSLSCAPSLGIGVHLNICQGKPLLPSREVESLIDQNGIFHAPAIQARKILLGYVDGSEIEAEFVEQIRWLKRRGVVPTHADSHQHMHMYSAAVNPFARALAAEGIQCARAPRCSIWPPAKVIGGPHEGNLLRRVLVQSYRSALQAIAFREFDMPQSRVSFLPRDRRDLVRLRDRWQAALENLPSGTFELACHPGFSEAGFSETDRICAQREAELRWLTDPLLCDAVKRSGIRLITYAQLAGARSSQVSAGRAAALGGRA